MMKNKISFKTQETLSQYQIHLKKRKNNERLIIKDLKKKFGSKTVVNGVNLKIYNG